MWILPRVSELGDLFFKILLASEFLQLEQYGSGLVEGIASAVRTTKPLKYRITIHRKGEFFTLAVSDSKAIIDAHWRYLTHDLAPLLATIDDLEDRKEFIVAKISGLAALEEGEEGKDEQKIIAFREAFPALHTENFVTYTSGLWWESRWITPSTGHMMLTDQSVAFCSSTDLLGTYKAVLPFKQISSITKEASLGILQNSIKLVCNNQDYFLLVINGRDKIFTVLESLWNDCMGHWKDLLDPAGVGRLAGQRKISLNMNLLTEKKNTTEFQEKFKVEDVANYDNTFFCSYQHDTLPFPKPGTLYITTNFLCYESSPKFPNPITLVIAWIHVDTITESSFLLVSNSFTIKTEFGNSFMFSVSNRNAVFKVVTEAWFKSRTYKKTRTQGLPPIPNSNGWTLDIKRLDETEYLNSQQEMKVHWDTYFHKCGFLPECCISQDFRDLIRNVGVPDVYRGQVWQLASGSLHNMEAMPGYYHELKESGDIEARVLEEISRDLHRSLPTHAFMCTQNGRDQLRNVLTTYAKRSPHIGYAQSMNILAATALMYMNEEEAFWLLSVICEKIVPEQFNSGLELLGSVVDQKIFVLLLEHYLPKLMEHLKKIEVPIVVITFPWFMTFFVGYIPWESSLRVLDIVLSSGTEALFQIGLAALAICEQEILELKNGEKIAPLIHSKLQDSKHLFQIAFTQYGELPRDKIEAWRKKQKFQVMSDLQSNQSHKICRRLHKTFPLFSLVELEKLHPLFLSHARRQTLTQSTGAKVHDVLDVSQFRSLLHELLPHTKSDKSVGVLHLLWQLRKDPPSDPKKVVETPTINNETVNNETNANQIDRVPQFPQEVEPPKPDPCAPVSHGLPVFLHARPDQKLMTFEDFLNIYVFLARGTLKEQFRLCTHLVHAENKSVSRQTFRTVLELLYRVSYDGDIPEDRNGPRLDRFVETIVKIYGGGANELSAAKMEDFTASFALEEFWTTLYF